jgi:hypothetical protein
MPLRYAIMVGLQGASSAVIISDQGQSQSETVFHTCGTDKWYAVCLPSSRLK